MQIAPIVHNLKSYNSVSSKALHPNFRGVTPPPCEFSSNDEYLSTQKCANKVILDRSLEAMLEILENLEIKPQTSMDENLRLINERIKENQKKVKNIVKTAYLLESDSNNENIDNLTSFMQKSIGAVKDIIRYLNITPSRDPVKNLNEIHKATVTDKLSELYNKRALFHDLQVILDKYQGSDEPFSIAMFDMDNFKSVNDLLGYTTGDEFIKVIAARINEIANKSNFKVYRFGGEEFFILMPGVKKEDCLPMVKEISDALNTDKTLESYIEEYIRKGETQIVKFQERQQSYKYFLDELKKFEFLEDIIKPQDNGSDTPLEVTKYTMLKLSEAAGSLHYAGIHLLTRAKIDSRTESEKKFVQKFLDEIRAGARIDKIYKDNESLQIYLANLYSYEAKISEIQKWINSVKLKSEKSGKSRGFTISSGVKEFNNYDMVSDAYIDQTGEVLKYAKRHLKGNVYSLDAKSDKPKIYTK